MQRDSSDEELRAIETHERAPSGGGGTEASRNLSAGDISARLRYTQVGRGPVRHAHDARLTVKRAFLQRTTRAPLRNLSGT